MAESKLDITDELLVAYIDDELDPARRELVGSVLAGNPALCRRADEMRLARDLLREAFPLRPEASVPAPIETAANRLAEACTQRPPRSHVTPFFRGRWKYAIAAGLILSVAVSATYLAWRAGRESAARSVTALMRIDPGTPLHDVLESSPSAQVINVPAEDAAARAVLTFRAKDGRFCREFEVLAGPGNGSTGVACRDHGEWRAEVLMTAAANSPDSNFYTPAGESDEPALGGVVKGLIQGDPLDAQDEARLIASGWLATETP